MLALFALISVPSWALIGGRPASGFPEIVQLRSGERVCTGTIIGPRAVLSAAHCANSEDPYFIYLGKRYSVRYVKAKETGPDLSIAIADKEISGVRVMKLGSPPKHGDPVLLAGFGCSERGGMPESTLHAGLSRIVGMDPEHLLSAAKGGGVLCKGDSGGPALVRQDGEMRMVAVNSLSNLKNLNVNVRLDSRASVTFLKEAARDHDFEISIPIRRSCVD